MEKISEIYKMLKSSNVKKVAVAAAADEDLLLALIEAWNMGIIKAYLFGEKKEIEKILKKLNSNPKNFEIIDIANIEEATRRAVEFVSEGKADIIMKGLVDTSTFMREVLNSKYDLKIEGNIVSSIAIVEVKIEGKTRIFFITDPGFIPLPNLEQKEKILNNAIGIMHNFGYKNPVVSILAAAEQVNPKVISTVEAKELEKKNQAGDIVGCRVIGPISLDLAVSTKSAVHKGFENPLAGLADLLLVPSIEVGNVLLKSLVYFSDAKVGGIVAGTKVPIIFTSRSDSSESKLYTIAIAAYLASN